MSYAPAEGVSPRSPHTIQVVAHRGASQDAPEHTLAAYRKAIEDGADALECDVRLTADGHLVCVHDRRVNRTSNGRGAVSRLELAELAALDFGSWKDPYEEPDHDPERTAAPERTAGPAWTARLERLAAARRGTSRQPEAEAPSPQEATSRRPEADAPDPDPAAVDGPDAERRSVLTLERLLELVSDAGRPVELAIETKHPTRWAGQVEERLLETLDRFGLREPAGPERSRVRVMSFSARSLRRVRAGAPGIPTVFLMSYVTPPHRDGSLPPGVRIAAPGIRILRANPGYVEKLHAAGHQVHVWTVDEPRDVELCVRLGVDAIITNRPKQVLRQLGRVTG